MFDRTARLFGDPAEISSFRSAFYYLQFNTASSLLIKSALNILSLYKWRKIINVLVLHYRHGRRDSTTESSTVANSRRSSILLKVKDEIKKRSVANVLLSSTFFLAGSSVFIYSIVAITSSTELCSKHSQCGVISYQWNVGYDHCTCLMFVDRETAPRTFSEWINPTDITASLSALSVAGELRIIQVINRAIPELPIEVTKSDKLEQLILVYTHTTRLPDWVSSMSKLEYVYVVIMTWVCTSRY